MADDKKQDTPEGPPMRTYDYSTHVGPNEHGLHDAAVHAQQVKGDGDEGREAGGETRAVPSPVITRES